MRVTMDFWGDLEPRTRVPVEELLRARRGGSKGAGMEVHEDHIIPIAVAEAVMRDHDMTLGAEVREVHGESSMARHPSTD